MANAQIPTHADILQATIELDGQTVDATWRPSGVLQWRGHSSAGKLDFRHQVYGFRSGSSSLTVFWLNVAQPRGCVGGNSKKVAEVRLDFGDDVATHSQWVTAIQSWFDLSGRPKKLLVLVNPKGGQGNASRIFSATVEPMFLAARIEVTKQETQYYRHAIDVAREVQLSAFDGIVCVSGDGVLVEVLNGLLGRPDWSEAIKIPLGIIPAGSGNGIAKSVLSLAGEDCDPVTATLNIIKGGSTKIDVSTVSQGSRRFHCLLNLTWGIVSDVDIESEKYRWMGGFRLTFQSVIRILSLRKYSGRVSYLLADSAPSTGSESLPAVTDGTIGFPGCPVQSLDSRQHWKEIDGNFVLLWLQNVPWAATDMNSHPRAQFSDGFLDAVVVRDVGKFELLDLFLKMEKGTHLSSGKVEYFKVKAIRLEPGGRTRGSVQGGYVVGDGEVLARGRGSVGSSRDDMMSYDEPFEVTVQQGLATLFAPNVSN